MRAIFEVSSDQFLIIVNPKASLTSPTTTSPHPGYNQTVNSGKNRPD
jgi:hypothetical protein